MDGALAELRAQWLLAGASALAVAFAIAIVVVVWRRSRKPARWWLVLGLAGAVAAAAPAWAQPSQLDPVEDASGSTVDVNTIQRCHLGTAPGKICAADGDCPGSATAGRCATVVKQQADLELPPWAVTKTEQRSVGTSAVDAFSADTQPCVSVRIKNIGLTTLYVGYSGVATSSGVPILPGEYGPPMYVPATRNCRDVKIISDASGGAAAVLTP